MDSQLLSIEEDTKNANTVKEIVISRLLSDKVITEEQAEKYAIKFQIIVVKYGWFERWFKTLSGRKPESYCYKYVRFED